MSAVGAFILLPLLYLGGVFFSIENLHPIWKTLAQFNPLLYLINGVRYGVLGVSDVSLGTSAIVALVSLPPKTAVLGFVQNTTKELRLR